MKIILLRDIPKIGRKYEVKDVADGYARNFLLPHKQAEPATEQALARIGGLRSQKEGTERARRDLLVAHLGKLDGASVTIALKANEKGGLFSALDEADVASAIGADMKIALAPEMITLEERIKSLGSYTVVIRAGDVSARATLVVENALQDAPTRVRKTVSSKTEKKIKK